MAYSDKVLDHYENPRNVGKMNDDDVNVGTGMVGAPTIPVPTLTSSSFIFPTFLGFS